MNAALRKMLKIEPKPQEISDTQVLYWAKSIIETKFRRSNYLNSPWITRDFLRLALCKKREVFSVIF